MPSPARTGGPWRAGREIFDAVELVSPRALGAFDMAVELGPLRRQDEEAQVALSACVLELGPELRPAIVMPSTRKGTSAMSLSRRAAAQSAVARPATRTSPPGRKP